MLSSDSCRKWCQSNPTAVTVFGVSGVPFATEAEPSWEYLPHVHVQVGLSNCLSYKVLKCACHEWFIGLCMI